MTLQCGNLRGTGNQKHRNLAGLISSKDTVRVNSPLIKSHLLSMPFKQ